VLRAFLEGVVEGTFDLSWVMRCPLCCAAASVTPNLEEVEETARCDGCQLEFEANQDDCVEAVFSPHPTLRVKPIDRFCTRFPAAAPDVHAVQILAPGETREVVVPLEEGRWLLSAGNATEPTVFTASADGHTEAISWRPGASWSDTVVKSGDVVLKLHNTGDHHERVMITHADGDHDRVTVSRLAAFPAFRRLFGHVGIAGHLRLRARRVALLFTDLASSVAFYQDVGDGAALSYVQSHVEVLRPILEQYGGAIVKSTGDGLFCAFDDPDMAVGCAITMMSRYDRWRAERSGSTPAMRIGIHTGTSLIVRTAWSPLDYFGMTVNLAARAEGLGAAGDIVWTQAVQDDTGVARRVKTLDLAPQRFEAQVKGLEEPITCYRLSFLS